MSRNEAQNRVFGVQRRPESPESPESPEYEEIIIKKKKKKQSKKKIKSKKKEKTDSNDGLIPTVLLGGILGVFAVLFTMK